jgi:hypothetical protein
MKPFAAKPLIFVGLAVFLSSATSRAQLGAPPPPATRVAQLDEAIALSAEQKAKALEIYQTESEVSARLTGDDRVFKTFQLRQASRQQVRALLTPDQQKKYEITPTNRGGGQTINPNNRVASLDREVTLTPAQKTVALEIFTEEAESLRALDPADRPGKGREYREAAKEQIHMLLTPEQRKKKDDLRTAAEMTESEERKFAENALRTSSAVAGRVGTVAMIVPSGGQIETARDVRKGRQHFEVTGKLKTEKLTVVWERSPASGPLKLIRIEDQNGHTVKP